MKAVGDADFYETQRPPEAPRVVTLGPNEYALGGPTGPIPAEFLNIPSNLEICQREPSASELRDTANLRELFLPTNYPPPYLNDILRGFRLVEGASAYLEIGVFDRGNLAHAAQVLADNALLVGVDIQVDEERDTLLRQHLKPGQRYVSVIGSSRDPSVVEKVRAELNGRPLDAVFIDGDHTAFGAMCDYVNYGAMVRQGGLVMFHDSLWEGDENYKGVSHVLAEIDRLTPVYLIPGRGPCYRFLPSMFRDPTWGVVGVLQRR